MSYDTLDKPNLTTTEDVLQPLGVTVVKAAEMLRLTRGPKAYDLVKSGHLRTYDISNKGSKRVLVHSIHEFANTGGVNNHARVPAGLRIARTSSTSKGKWGWPWLRRTDASKGMARFTVSPDPRIGIWPIGWVARRKVRSTKQTEKADATSSWRNDSFAQELPQAASEEEWSFKDIAEEWLKTKLGGGTLPSTRMS